MNEYNNRKSLAEMGYRFDSDDLDDYTAQVFLEIDRLYAKEHEITIKRKVPRK